MGLLSALLVVAIAAPADTVVAVRPGDRLSVSDLDGELTVVARDRDEVRVSDEYDPDLRIALARSGEKLSLEGGRHDRRLHVEVPTWMPLEVRGREANVRVRGSRASVTVRILEGAVEIADVEGDVDVHTVDGEIHARDVVGRVVLRSGDEDIRVQGARGSLTVVATDGDLTLEGIDVDRLEASTTDGDIGFSGAFRPSASYAVSTHDGDIVAAIPEGADVEVEVSTWSGSFRTGFPVTLDHIRTDRRTSFTLGRGGASLTLEAFDGDIVLRRPAGGVR